jgi:hypothetical protein
MNKKIYPSMTALVVSLFLLTSCKKEQGESGGPTGPNITYVTDGVLCTMGVNQYGVEDTLSYRYSGIDNITIYSKGFTKPGDEIRFTNNSNNTVSVEKKEPYTSNNKSYFYFAIQTNNGPNPLFPNHAYTFPALRDVKSVETEFVIKRNAGDSKKFTIESKAYPGQFLGTAKWRNATYPNESYLVFTTEPQEFFFLPD